MRIFLKEIKMSEETQEKNCHTCIFSHRMAGSAHRQCRAVTAKNAAAMAMMGIAPAKFKSWPGCGMFPINFDTSIVVECDLYKEGERGSESNGDDWDNPLLQIAAIMG